MDFIHDDVVKVLPGFGPKAHSRSIFTPAHATATYAAWQEFVKDPGPAVVGAAPEGHPAWVPVTNTS